MEISRDLILKSFLQESEDSLAQMEQAVLELEAHPDNAELVQAIFRVVHTTKGNSAILDLQALLSFTHSLEDFLDAIRGHRLAVTREITTVLLTSVDVIREMVLAAGAGKDEASPRSDEVLRSISLHLQTLDAVTENSGKLFHSPAASSEGVPVPASVVAGEAARTLRVDVSKLDRLLDLTGEITIARGRLTQLLENKEHIDIGELREAQRFADSLHTELQETILKARMVPVGPLLRQYARTVRDLARTHGKLAQLHVEGEDVEVDTSVVEHLKDPVLHMIRNAIDHGIEAPEVRRKAGKPPVGTITVRAFQRAGSIVMELSDDGAGLDRKKIMDLARKRGLAPEPERLSDHDIYQLIFESGFSTASQVSELSGRGVGMDVIRRNVQALRGTVHVSSRPGAGATVHIALPLTLAMIEGFGIGVGDETCVIPVDQVVECVELHADQVYADRTEGVLQLRGEPLPYLHLKNHFGFSGGRASRQNVIVVRHDSWRVGLAVDTLYGAMQTVIKPLPAIFRNVPGVSGSAILGNGRVALILDVAALLRDVQSQIPGLA
ncbi:MAG TPA: chemotaxis protein CheA [Candidatus Angelobacter sp.]|nr:chemotaxis protein CheA [Candidatus Angelobacter sp.]